MRYFCFFLFVFSILLSNSQANAQDLPRIKKLMVQAVESPQITNNLFKELTALKSQDPLIWAYIATLEGLKAKHSWNPYAKLRHISISSKMIQKAVNAAPDDLEIRFMRFSLQHFTPAFLGYSKNLEEDKNAIIRLFELRKFGRSDPDLVRNIAKFMLETKRCTAPEEQIFRKFA